MSHLTWIQKLSLLIFVTLLLGCSQKSVPNKSSEGRDGVRVVRPESSQSEDGGYSGGGSYGNEAGQFLLDESKAFLSKAIAMASPEIFAHLPADWSPQRLARIIETIAADNRTLPDGTQAPVIRDGEELYFDYRQTQGQEPRIVATRLFFSTHADLPHTQLSSAELAPLIRHNSLLILHEAMHLMGIGISRETDPRAREAAEAIFSALQVNNITCEITADQLPLTYFRFWQEYRYHDPILGHLCLEPMNQALDDFQAGLNEPIGEAIWRLNDYQTAEGDFDIDQRPLSFYLAQRAGHFPASRTLAWIIHRPSGLGMYTSEFHSQNNVDDRYGDLGISTWQRAQNAELLFLDQFDSDKRSHQRVYAPFYNFRNDRAQFYVYDAEARPEWNTNFLDWQSVEMDEQGQLIYESQDQVMALVFTQDPSSRHDVGYRSEICLSHKVVYESESDITNGYFLEEGIPQQRFDMHVGERLVVTESSTGVSARLHYEQTLGPRGNYDYSPVIVPTTNRVSAHFDLNCQIAVNPVSQEFFTPDN